MVAINFMKQFAPLILDGSKIHTLRDKARCKAGDALQLYYGQRTRQCQLLKVVVCTAVVPIEFIAYKVCDELVFTWIVNDRNLKTDEAYHAFAISDGFESTRKMGEWFSENKGWQWHGFLIAWGEANYLPEVK